MKPSAIRPVLGFAVTVALAACSGRGSSPLPQLLSPSQGTAATACASGGGFPFNGPCTAFTFVRKGVTAKLGVNKGYSVSHVFPANTFGGSLQLHLGSAVLSQIGKNAAGASFPAYTSGGTAFLYLIGVSPRQSSSFYFKGPVKWVIATTARFPGTVCRMAALEGRQWFDTGIRAKPSGKQLVLSISDPYETDIVKGKTYAALACR
jgi:hypothetical protein